MALAMALDLHVVFHLGLSNSERLQGVGLGLDLGDARIQQNYQQTKTTRAAGVFWLLAVCL